MQDSEQRMGMVPGPNPRGTVPEDEMEPWELRGRSGDGHVLCLQEGGCYCPEGHWVEKLLCQGE